MTLSHKLVSKTSRGLCGTLTPPGDKSISHRSLIFGSLAEGTSTVRGLLESADVMGTMGALRAMGASFRKKEGEDLWLIDGVGLDGLRAPESPMDLGNSGTSARLLIGLVAGLPFSASFTGDASLQKRPMSRVIEPLSQMGASFESLDERLPLTVKGTASLRPMTYTLPVASAQVKSAILLAGLHTEGVTSVIEPEPTRDHSENMLRAFGASIHIEKNALGQDVIALTGRPSLAAQNIVIPADPSSAAFPLVAALLVPESRVTLRHVGLNPRRAGLIEVLLAMGAKIDIADQHLEGGEPVADLTVESSELHSLDVPASQAPRMIDEYPILAVAAACAKGRTHLRGLHELRVKESDRLDLMARGLARCGADVVVEGDDLIVTGTGAPPPGGVLIDTAMDHRIAMSFLVLGLCAPHPVAIDDSRFIATSFPSFVSMMNALGASIDTPSS
ncbi:MAG: 3-phosphoshikimate 1-carboxyvinyltransferase [Alphaproteobacteria bacterium]|nr:3-phosphoshikimate 1-carboxyvinyltransferase [Alphaproteobacteria bacterium]